MSKPARTTLLSVAGLLALGVLILLVTDATRTGPIPYVGRGAVAGVLLFGITGLAAAARLTPRPLQPVWPIFALPAGAVLGSLTLTGFGFAAVPTKYSVWIVLVLGAAAWLRWGHRRAPRIDLLKTVPWVVAGVVAVLIATIPDWRLDQTSIFGQNPDSHQVVGTAELFQDAPAYGVRAGTPINVVPSAWDFRHPIIYALAGTSTLAKFDPIFVFPALSALLVALAALGFGALAVLCLRLPLAAGPWVAIFIPLNALVLHIAWHPYYNQLWGLALLPWALAMGWWAVRERSRSAGLACLGLMVMLALAYSLVVLYPVLLVAAMVWAHRIPRPRIPQPRGVLQWIGAVVLVGLLSVPLVGAIDKIAEGAKQLVDIHANLWGGDLFVFLPLSEFVGTNGGALGALAVLAVAVVTVVRRTTKREAIALGALLFVCVLFDVRLRISDRGQYMDLKHLGYVGAIVLALAAAGVISLALTRRREYVLLALVLMAAWFVPAVGRISDVSENTKEQVTADMLELREWAKELPPDASIRVDIPPSGVQLWAQYMLSSHPLSALYPVTKSTYARMPYGLAADYVLTPRFVAAVPNSGVEPKKWPQPMHATGKPVRSNYSFILRRLEMPYQHLLDNSSRLMVQP